jgi:lycopene cyclase domain-containing protein
LAVYLYKKASFPSLKVALQAISLIAIPYIIWDVMVTGKWWEFNAAYVLGIKALGLPIEEWLFFFVVPWAMLLLWHNRKSVISQKKTKWSAWLFLSFALAGFLVATQSLYGFVVVTLYWVLLLILKDKIFQLDWVVLASTTFLATLVFNSYLTWRPVVIYQEQAISGFRLGTIPIEDFYYGMVLILGIIYTYERLTSSRQKLIDKK